MSESTSYPITITVHQPAVNALRALLNADKWASGLEDFYYAGKLLSECPKAKLLTNPTQEDVDKLMTETATLVIPDAETHKVIKNAFKYYINEKKHVTEHHYELLVALGINPKSSL